MAEEVDRAQRSGQLGLAEEVLARATAGEVLELLDHRRRRDRDRECRESKVEPGQTQGRDAEQKAGAACDERGERDRPEVLDAVVGHQDRGRVPTDAHEGAVPERDLPGVPGQHVETEQGDCEDADVRGLLLAEPRQITRHHGDRDRERRERGERYSQTPHLSHTRFTAVLPNSPDGRSSSTTRITASAAGSRRSAPMKST